MQQYDSILCHKSQGELTSEGNLMNDDFILGIQTEYQKDMMKAFAKNLVCIDSTHCTTAYDFKLIIIMIIDSYGEGIPVAWLIWGYYNCHFHVR